MAQECDRYAGLEAEVDEVLQKLVELTWAQKEAFMSRNEAEFMPLDKELEIAVGKKERIFGAFHQHNKEHGCQH